MRLYSFICARYILPFFDLGPFQHVHGLGMRKDSCKYKDVVGRAIPWPLKLISAVCNSISRRYALDMRSAAAVPSSSSSLQYQSPAYEYVSFLNFFAKDWIYVSFDVADDVDRFREQHGVCV